MSLIQQNETNFLRTIFLLMSLICVISFSSGLASIAKADDGLAGTTKVEASDQGQNQDSDKESWLSRAWNW